MAKVKRTIPVKRDSRMQGLQSLQFDNASEFNYTELSPEEKSETFMSKYLEVMNPVGRYKDYFDSSGYSISHLLKIIKDNYKLLVLDKGWEEVKFVTITNEIFNTERVFAPGTYDFLSRMYDKGELESQQKTTSRTKRRL